MMDWIAAGAMAAATIKKAVKIADEMGDVEMKGALLDVLQYNQELRERNLELQAGNAELAQRLVLREQLVFRGNVYWREIDGSPESDGPYCPKCQDADNKLVHMAIVNGSDGVADAFACVSCKLRIRARPARTPRVVTQRSGAPWVRRT